MLKKIGLVTVWILCLVFFDVVICRSILGLGHPRDFSTYHSVRPPRAYVEFTAEWLARDSAFDKTHFWHDENPKTIRVAFFGGSTGVPVNEKLFADKLSELFKQKVDVVNFSCFSANHTQHLHMLLEVLHNGTPDIVVFYGGFNETIQNGWFDPRPGYPYSYYFRNEMSSFKRLLVEKSALFGALEWKYNIISHIGQLRKEYKPFQKEWNEAIKNKYFENLALAKRVTESLPSRKFKHAKFIAFYQPYQSDKIPDFVKTHEEIRAEIKKIDYITDLHDIYKPLSDKGKKIYFDECHVHQQATDLATVIMANIIAKKYAKK